MKLKILLNLGNEWPEQLAEGAVVDADEKLAQRMLREQVAEEVRPEAHPGPHRAQTARLDRPPVVATGDAGGTPIAALGLKEGIVDALRKAGLSTVQDVQSFAEANNGLTGIAGIGEASEKEVREAISAL